jgi:hypothetical protein
MNKQKSEKLKALVEKGKWYRMLGDNPIKPLPKRQAVIESHS